MIEMLADLELANPFYEAAGKGCVFYSHVKKAIFFKEVIYNMWSEESYFQAVYEAQQNVFNKKFRPILGVIIPADWDEEKKEWFIKL